MSTTEQKTETLNLRVSQQFKSLLQSAARRERRSMANMVEFLVIEYAKQHGVPETALTHEHPTENKKILP
jgi:uncharacterized protein (DUF1778 family)